MKINLLPPSHRKHTSRFAAIFGTVMLLACIAMPPAYYVFKLSEYNVSLVEQNRNLEARIVELKPIATMLENKSLLDNLVKALIGATTQRQAFDTVAYVDELSLVLPPQVNIQELQLDNQRLTIRGDVPTYALAAKMLSSFMTSQSFDSPVMSGLTDSGSTYRFELSATVKIGVSKP